MADIVRWAPSANERDRREMLEKIGVRDPLELYSDVPRSLLVHEKRLNVGFGRPLSEWELFRLFTSLMSRNRVFLDPPPFMGGGLCFHVVPAAVEKIVGLPEFLTAYTPYQPEINQGVLQALFEYQSLIADLTGMDVVNASMYDMSTAVAEAFLMAVRVTRRTRILVPETMHPEHLEVARTWCYGKGIKIDAVPVDHVTGKLRLDVLESMMGSDVAAVYMEVPSYLGVIDDGVEAVSDLAHKYGALFIVGVEPLSLGLLKPPGEYGADIVVGEGQPLGLGLNYGGPLLGIFAVKWDRRLVRQMPGRLVGLTRDAEGERAFTLILQTREQHIRREKATSNITTNEALMAIAAAAYLALLGGDGLRRLARSIWLRSHYAARRLSELPGVRAPALEAEFFKEFTVSFKRSYRELHRKLLEKGILGGYYVGDKFPWLGETALFCVTEAHSMKDIDRLVEALAEVV